MLTASTVNRDHHGLKVVQIGGLALPAASSAAFNNTTVLCRINTGDGFAEVQTVADTNDPELRLANPRQIDEVRFGDTGWDRVLRADGNDRPYGGADGDLIPDGAGRDRIEGGAGDDTIQGRGGTDSFVFHDGFGGDAIRDVDASAEIIDLARVTSVSGFADLTIVQVSGNSVVIIGADSTTLEGVARAERSAADFAFRREGAGARPPFGPVTGRS